MNKIAVVYWSGTGNTEAMAKAVLDGIRENGGEGVMMTSAEFNSSMMDDFDAIAFGCPSMGAETLEDSEFEPMFNACESKLNGKKIGLFGSYGWGDGQWMRDWEKECRDLGLNLASDFVMANDSPDDAAREACIALGKALA